jgi:hypothetical protein
VIAFGGGGGRIIGGAEAGTAVSVDDGVGVVDAVGDAVGVGDVELAGGGAASRRTSG